jgi:hypothetical protein
MFVFIYVYLCPTRLPYQMMFVSFNSNTTGVNGVTGTAYPSRLHELTPDFYCILLCSVSRPFSGWDNGVGDGGLGVFARPPEEKMI